MKNLNFILISNVFIFYFTQLNVLAKKIDLNNNCFRAAPFEYENIYKLFSTKNLKAYSTDRLITSNAFTISRLHSRKGNIGKEKAILRYFRKDDRSLYLNKMNIETEIKRMIIKSSGILNKVWDQAYSIKKPSQFGITGDGITDETEKIQKLFDSIMEGEKVQFDKKTYKISATIYLNRDLKNVTIDFGGATFINEANASGITFFGLSGIYAIKIPGKIALNTEENSNTITYSSTVSGLLPNNYIIVNSTDNISVKEKSYFKGEFNKVLSTSRTKVNLVTPLYYSNIATSVSVQKVNTLVGCTFKNLKVQPVNERDAVFQYNGIEKCIFDNININPLTICNLGISLNGAFNCVIKNCVIRNIRSEQPVATGYGINIAGLNCEVKNCNIMGCRHNFTVASRLQLSQNIVFKNCLSSQASGTGASGYDLHSQAHNTIFFNCISKDDARGFSLRQIGIVRVNNCKVISSHDKAMALYCDAANKVRGVFISKCIFKKNAKMSGNIAINIDDNTAVYENIEISNCIFEDNGKAVDIDLSTSVLQRNINISDNNFVSTNGQCINVTAADAIIVRNTIKNFGVASFGIGIYVLNTLSGKIINNSFKKRNSNESSAIRLDGNNGFLIVKNNKFNSFPNENSEINIVNGSKGKIKYLSNLRGKAFASISGTVTLTAGTATVNTPYLIENSKINLILMKGSVSSGRIKVTTRIPGNYFTILSSDSTDTATVFWTIINK